VTHRLDGCYATHRVVIDFSIVVRPASLTLISLNTAATLYEHDKGQSVYAVKEISRSPPRDTSRFCEEGGSHPAKRIIILWIMRGIWVLWYVTGTSASRSRDRFDYGPLIMSKKHQR
jgi:hypothetical protein